MLQGLDHLLNFLLTPLGTGLVFALLAKGVFWRASLSGLSWRQAVVRAMGGAGLVYTEMTCVSPEGRITPGCPGLYTSEQVAA